MDEVEVIFGNSNKRFSGVTSTMLATLPGIAKNHRIAILGSHFVPEGYEVISFWRMVRLCKHPLPTGKSHVFHARRNDEMIQALCAKKLFGAKLSIVFTSTAQRHHSKFTKWLISQMDGVISTCEAAAQYLDKAPDTIIPHGVDLNEFPPAKNRATLWKSFGHGGEFGIGIFGRVRESKGTDLLVRAAIPILKSDPRPTVVIIGETTSKYQPFQAELQSEIDAAGLSNRILFLGKLPFSEVKRYFQGVSLVTALSRNEGFGLTVLEAMASGASVIATKAGAWEEILQHQQNSIVHNHTIESIKESLLNKLNKSDLLQEGVANRQYVEEYHSVDQEIKMLSQYYQLSSERLLTKT